MNYEEWRKLYAELKRELAQLGLHFDRDEEARDVLNSLLKQDVLKELNSLEGKNVVVFAAGESSRLLLLDEKFLRVARKAIVIATDGILDALFNAGLNPRIVCTDLDSDFEFISKASSKGAVIIVHAHGDNIPQLKEFVPKLKGKIVGTTQVEPKGAVHNFGGFIDGDRAVFLALHFNAKAVGFAGFNAKKKKHEAGIKLVEQLKKNNKNIFNLSNQKELNAFVKLV
ncbi:DUF115 domain-containing protein [Candidatus Micrarchaeota archaeon]|nr:DUF115 domain-containing protein [Candidatus Micrarchaeota archaeon]